MWYYNLVYSASKAAQRNYRQADFWRFYTWFLLSFVQGLNLVFFFLPLKFLFGISFDRFILSFSSIPKDNGFWNLLFYFFFIPLLINVYFVYLSAKKPNKKESRGPSKRLFVIYGIVSLVSMHILFFTVGFVYSEQDQPTRTTKKINETSRLIEENRKLMEQNEYRRPEPSQWDTIKDSGARYLFYPKKPR